MPKLIIIRIFCVALVTAITASASAQEWAIKADFASSCSCNMPCPCAYGESPTLGYCETNALFEIEEGHYGNVGVDGLSLVTSWKGGDWIKFYVSNKATDEQVKAVKELLVASLNLFSKMKVLSIEKAPVSVERGDKKIKFSVPEVQVEIVPVIGLDGTPLKLQNSKNPIAQKDHSQYKSIVNTHTSEDKKFSHSGTNGLTSRIEYSSKK